LKEGLCDVFSFPEDQTNSEEVEVLPNLNEDVYIALSFETKESRTRLSAFEIQD